MAPEQEAKGSSGACKELRESAEGIWEMLENGTLVRNTRMDAGPDWAMKQIPIVRALARFGAALGKP